MHRTPNWELFSVQDQFDLLNANNCDRGTPASVTRIWSLNLKPWCSNLGLRLQNLNDKESKILVTLILLKRFDLGASFFNFIDLTFVPLKNLIKHFLQF